MGLAILMQVALQNPEAGRALAALSSAELHHSGESIAS